MEQWGNSSTFNLEGVLQQRIQESDYFKSLVAYSSWSEVIDQIYYEVSNPSVTEGTDESDTIFSLFDLFMYIISRRKKSTLIQPPSPPQKKIA